MGSSLFFGLLLLANIGQVLVPLDHQMPESKLIAVQYTFENSFDEAKETVFLLDDPLDAVYQTFDPAIVLGGDWNVIRIHGRQHSPEIKNLVLYRGSPNWKAAYRLYNQHQVAQDVELVRRKLLGNKKVNIVGHSSSAAALLYYMSLFPENVHRSIMLSPMLFDVQKNLSFSSQTFPFLKGEFALEEALLFDFCRQTGFDISRIKKDEQEAVIHSNLLVYALRAHLIPGFVGRSRMDEDFALQVRMFEHAFAQSGLGAVGNVHPFRDWMKKFSEDIWEAYEAEQFSVFGNHYDKGELYAENLFILGGKYDLLVNPKSYEVLAEFFPNSTLALLNDGHALNRLKSSGLMAPILIAFLENSVEKKIQAFEDMRKISLIHR